ncbi:MAG: glycosyltransferase [Spirochaetia bacterium]|nr:glycosyltransferase [Spirochaetia bacterium]
MQLPKITVVTPSFNQGDFLRETIESVLNQNYPNLEYFIIDGGSTDNSVEIIKQYEDKIDWWVSEKDKGQSDAIRKGFERATGQLLAWLNSDDVYFPNALIKIGEAYMKNSNAAIFAGGLAVGEIKDGPIKKCSLPSKVPKFFYKYGMIGTGQQASFFNTDVYKKTKGIDINLFIRMDMDIMYRMLKENPEICVIKEMVGFFRWHEKTKSTKSAEIFYKEWNNFYKEINVSTRKIKFTILLLKIYKIFNMIYFKSWLMTIFLKGKYMKDVWKEHTKK